MMLTMIDHCTGMMKDGEDPRREREMTKTMNIYKRNRTSASSSKTNLSEGEKVNGQFIYTVNFFRSACHHLHSLESSLSIR